MPKETIYVPHYFHGEYDIPEILRAVNLPWRVIQASVYLDGPTMNNLIEDLDLDEDSINDYLMSLHGVSTEEDEPIATVLAIEYDPELLTEQWALNILNIGINITIEAYGDDDREDYMPDTVRALIAILSKVGHQPLADRLIQELDKVTDKPEPEPEPEPKAPTKYSTAHLDRLGMEYEAAYPSPGGINDLEGLYNWEAGDPANRVLQILKSEEEAKAYLKSLKR
jgi:hypothetical protein